MFAPPWPHPQKVDSPFFSLDALLRGPGPLPPRSKMFSGFLFETLSLFFSVGGCYVSRSVLPPELATYLQLSVVVLSEGDFTLIKMWTFFQGDWIVDSSLGWEVKVFLLLDEHFPKPP